MYAARAARACLFNMLLNLDILLEKMKMEGYTGRMGKTEWYIVRLDDV